MADSEICAAHLSGKRALVWVRTRPTNKFAKDQIKLFPDGQSIVIHRDRDLGKGVVNNEVLDWTFKFDRILHNASQELVYSGVAAEMVGAALQGFNGTIIAYGQTGAGKTFTMTGSSEMYNYRGIVPRALSQLFQHIENNPDYYFSVRISYLEIYNEVMHDLLETLPGSSFHSGPMCIIEDAHGGISVKGLRSHLASTEEDALNMLFVGEANRVIGPHCLNKLSSRSHCIFTLYILSHSRYESDPKYAVSKLHFVDLAGSERLKKTQSEGLTKSEAMSINKSLSFLQQTVMNLSKHNRRVPYRQSHLTHFLKDSLGGNCLTRLIANIWVEASQIEETISTLRFASRMMSVSVKPIANVHFNALAVIKQLEQELFWLKKELAMHDIMSNRAQVSYDPPTDRQRLEIVRLAKQFLNGQINDIEIVNLRQLQVILESFREISSQIPKEVEAKLRARYTMVDKTDPVAIAAAQSAGLPIGDDGELIGELTASGFSIGPASPGTRMTMSSSRKKAPKKAKTHDRSENMKQSTVGLDEKISISVPDASFFTSSEMKRDEVFSSPSSTKLKEMTRPSTPPKKSEAFEEFKKDAGIMIYGILKENKELLLSKKNALRSTAKKINETKQDIDSSIVKLQKLRHARLAEGVMINENGEVIIDEVEYNEMQKALNLRTVYRSEMEELNSLKREIQYCEKQIELVRQKMVQEFDLWYADSFLTPETAVETQASGISIIIPEQKKEVLPKVASETVLEDEHEKFEKLQLNLLMANPNSVPFYKAQLRQRRREIFDAAMAQFSYKKSPRIDRPRLRKHIKPPPYA